VQHTLEVHDLQFSYPNGFHALRDVSFSIGPGEKVALVGPNGAGKSTLMLHLNGLLRASAGEICVRGQPLGDDNLGQIRAWVGLVFQNPDDQLFNPIVFDDVAFGPLHMGLPEEEVRQRSTDALAAVGMADYADQISHHLSVGQKKRVAIATVLSMSPQILVLDEPSAGLDPHARRSLMDLLNQVEQTMLIATHDMRMVLELFPRTVVMDEGRIVADGLTAALLNDAALMTAHGLERP
jgi:cobalt/nickel transport system ATP-binding protein